MEQVCNQWINLFVNSFLARLATSLPLECKVAGEKRKRKADLLAEFPLQHNESSYIFYREIVTNFFPFSMNIQHC